MTKPASRTKRVVIYPGVDLLDAVRSVEAYLKTEQATQTGEKSWLMYASADRKTGEILGEHCQIYSTATQIVVKP